jgi:hypothetical protein
MFPETCFPLNWDCNKIYEISDKILNNDKGYILAPYLQDFNLQAIKRNYNINIQKSILNI